MPYTLCNLDKVGFYMLVFIGIETLLRALFDYEDKKKSFAI